MKEEKLLRAIGGIDDDLIASAMEPKKKTHPSWVRWAAVAACLGLLLVSPVGAAVIGSIREEGNSFSTPERYPIAQFSHEAIVAAAGQDGHFLYPMDTLDQAMEFVGLKYLNNAILENASPKQITSYTEYSQVHDAAFMVRLDVADGDIYMADVQAHYTIGQASVDVQYVLSTDLLTYGGGVAIAPEDIEIREDYTTPAGLVCVLYTHTGYHEREIADCTALAAKDDCLIWVTVSHYDSNTAMSTLKEIMDAYS